LERKFAWPKIDTMRRWIGRAPTKKGPGDAVGQESLI
jgi:hypothetical protein